MINESVKDYLKMRLGDEVFDKIWTQLKEDLENMPGDVRNIEITDETVEAFKKKYLGSS